MEQVAQESYGTSEKGGWAWDGLATAHPAPVHEAGVDDPWGPFQLFDFMREMSSALLNPKLMVFMLVILLYFLISSIGTSQLTSVYK